MSDDKKYLTREWEDFSGKCLFTDKLTPPGVEACRMSFYSGVLSTLEVLVLPEVERYRVIQEMSEELQEFKLLVHKVMKELSEHQAKQQAEMQEQERTQDA